MQNTPTKQVSIENHEKSCMKKYLEEKKKNGKEEEGVHF